MEVEKFKRVKLSRRDYPLAFKLQVFRQVEHGEMTYKQSRSYYGIPGKSTVLVWLRKNGTLDWNNPLKGRARQNGFYAADPPLGPRTAIPLGGVSERAG